jgi:hypothetical protein
VITSRSLLINELKQSLTNCSPAMKQKVLQRLEWERRKEQKKSQETAGKDYRYDPVGYALDVLKIEWWPVQQEIANALIKHKRVFVKAGHSVGKSHLAGGLVSWFYDSYPVSICLTTAPTEKSVTDIIWKEVRMQRPLDRRADLFPKAPRMESSPEHFAVGYTASGESSFHGRHEESIFLIYDECVGIDKAFWTAGEGMMSSPVAYWLALCNPTDTASAAYEECMTSGNWHVIDISCLDHPNIAAELAGNPRPFPKAVDLAWVEGRINSWCERIPTEDKKARDFEFPPGSGEWYRPGPLGECRLLGRWPTTGSTSVWNESMWAESLKQQALPTNEPTAIGCDKARFGDDFTSILVRRGSCALHHETHNGWDNNQIAGRLKQLCGEFAAEGENPLAVMCQIDDVQGGVVDQANAYKFVEINSANKAIEEEGYPNRRSELWFTVAERADKSRLDLSRLNAQSLKLLRSQAMAPTWKVDSQGRRVVEPKSDTKKRIKRSPDDMDALNLAFAVPRVAKTHTLRVFTA